MRARAERFGAIVRLEQPPALVSIDRALARRAGIDGGALWSGDSPGLDVRALTAPTEAHVSVTTRCPAGCTGCYADARRDGHEPTFDDLRKRLEALAAAGVFSIAFGGGEASLREDLPELGRVARSLGLVPTFTTSGLGITPERAHELGAFAQVNVSYDGGREVYSRARGWDGAEMAERAIAVLRDAGLQVGVNTLLIRATFDELEQTAARVEALGAVELQLLRYKPAGRGKLDYLATRLSHEQIERFPALVRSLSEARSLAIRIDCALVPFLASGGEVSAEWMRRLGVMGCEGGRSLLATRADGAALPCSFWGGSDAPAASDLDHAWERDPTIERFRAHAETPPEPCAACDFRSVCRGGCRVVARELAGTPWAPDPECPRVRAHKEIRS